MNNDKHDDDCTGSHHFFAASLDASSDPVEYIRQLDVQLTQFLEMGQLLYTAIRREAPVLLGSGGLTRSMLATLGATLMMAQKSVREFLTEQGVEPLDLEAERLRVARETLAEADCPAELRDRLLEILAAAMNGKGSEKDGDDSEWPEILMPGGSEVH